MSVYSVQVLRNFDSFISTNCTKELQNSGIDLWKNSQVRSVSKTDKGLEVTIATRDPERKNEDENLRTIQEVDCLLWAIGRQPNIAGLNLGHLVRVIIIELVFFNPSTRSLRWGFCYQTVPEFFVGIRPLFLIPDDPQEKADILLDVSLC